MNFESRTKKATSSACTAGRLVPAYSNENSRQRKNPSKVRIYAIQDCRVKWSAFAQICNLWLKWLKWQITFLVQKCKIAPDRAREGQTKFGFPCTNLYKLYKENQNENWTPLYKNVQIYTKLYKGRPNQFWPSIARKVQMHTNCAASVPPKAALMDTAP